MADRIHVPPEAPGAASKAAGDEEAQKFGLTAAMALIVGSIIGVLHTIKSVLVATLG